MASNIGLFYAVQGIVSIFMPAIVGIIADRWVPAQRMLGICHLLAAIFMASAGYYAMSAGSAVEFSTLFSLYTASVAFYMPTLALSYSVAYSALERAGEDTVKAFPPIRVWGTVGFICSMLVCDFAGFQTTYMQFMQCATLGVVLGLYAMTLPECPVGGKGESKGLVEALGLEAFKLFKQRQMALFFIFSMLLGVSLQITNSFANPFISSYKDIAEFASTFGANHANALISLSQVSETLCILLIPFCLKRFGIKKVMLIAMFAWVLRFGLFGLGNPGGGVWMFILSMIVYGVAFDFFNISGSLYVNEQTDEKIRSVDEIRKWSNPRLHRYNKINYMHRLGKWQNIKNKGSKPPCDNIRLIKTMHTMSAKYGIHWHLCSPYESAEMIVRLLSGERG